MAKRYSEILALRFYDHLTKLIYPVDGAFFERNGGGHSIISDVMIQVGMRDVRHEGVLLGWTKVQDRENNPIYDQDVVEDDDGQIWFIKWRDDWSGFRAISPDGKYTHQITNKMKIIGNSLQDKKEENAH